MDYNQGPIHCVGRGVQVCVNVSFAGLADLIPCFYVFRIFYEQVFFYSGGRSDILLINFLIQLVNCLDKPEYKDISEQHEVS